MLISVIIATYNRSQSLKKVLDGLLVQEGTQDWDYEVLVIDNNSRDQTKDIVLGYTEKFKGRLKYLFEPKQGKCHALNLGIHACTGEFILFTDDDVIIDQRWFSAIMACYRLHSCDAIGGRVLPVYPEGTPQWVKNNAKQLSGAVVIFDNGERTFRLWEEKDRFIGANCSVKRSVALQVGGFRPEIGNDKVTVGEDADFYNRIIAGKKTVYYCGDALIWHPFEPCRLGLKHVARWNKGLGRYMAICDLEKGKKFVCYGGVPRYLFRAILLDSFKLFAVCFNRPKFFIAWRDLFCKIGSIQAYQKF